VGEAAGKSQERGKKGIVGALECAMLRSAARLTRRSAASAIGLDFGPLACCEPAVMYSDADSRARRRAEVRGVREPRNVPLVSSGVVRPRREATPINRAGQP